MKPVLSISIEILVLIMVSSCLKEKPAIPIISTTAITGITQATATSGGEVINDGGASITLRGVCWSTSPDPTTEDSKTILPDLCFLCFLVV